MFNAVVFDMDGVIFDTEKLYRKYQLLEGKRLGVPRDVMVDACEHIAGGNKESNRAVFESIVGRGIDYFAFRLKVLEGLDAHIKENGVELKPYVRETLKFLKDKGLKVGLATSTEKNRAMTYLRDNKLDKYFDGFVFGDMVKHGKPAPDIYLKACEELGVLPEEAIAVEDSINGIKSAGRGGLYPIMVVDLIEPNNEVRPYAKQIYRSMEDLMEFLDS